MKLHISPSTAALLCVAPLMWAANAFAGRELVGLVPPVTLNFLRWVIAFLILLPLGWRALKPSRWLPYWKHLTMLGFFGMACYNALQYLALETSTPMNVTLVAASSPIWMLLVGQWGFGSPMTRRQLQGAVLSIAGVLVVLSRGDVHALLQLHLVPGDLYMLLAALTWAIYSWMLTRHGDLQGLRHHWADFLLVQLAFGIVLSGLCAGVEWAVMPVQMVWNLKVAGILLFIALGPALLAYYTWGIGVGRAGPVTSSFFGNLTPLFTALMSSTLWGEWPQLYHGLAFVLIVGGIFWSSRQVKL